MTGPSEHDLHRRFEALRTEDERNAPGYRSVLDRAPRAASAVIRAGSRRRLVAALAIAAAIVLAVVLPRVSRPHGFIPQPLSTWTSPTASLLRTSGPELFASRTLLPSSLDHLRTTFAQR